MRGRKLLLLNAARGGNWLANNAILYDEFLTPDAAPLTSPRTCEPGPGTMVVTQPSNQVSISGGKLVWSAVAEYSGVASNVAASNVVGMAIFAELDSFTSGVTMQLGTNNDATPTASLSGPHIHLRDGTIFRVANGEGGFVEVGGTYSYPMKSLVVFRSLGVGSFDIMNGTLAWVFDSRDTDVYPSLVSHNSVCSWENLWVGNLATTYNTAWGADFSTVTDTKTNPATTTTYDCAADCHLRVTHTCENTKFVQAAIRYTNDTNYVRLEIDASRVPTLKKNVAGTPATLWTGAALTDAVEYQFDIVAEGSSVKVNQDNVLKTTQTVTDHQTVTGGKVWHDLASNDIVLSTHPYPSLGIATDRVIAPQAAGTATHEADCLAYMRGITLPSSGSLQYEFRG